MGQASPLRRKLRARRPGPRSLTVRLAAVAVCLLAAGAAIMVVAGSLATRDTLVRQAGEQLRSYAGQLARYPFLLTPLSRTGPGPPGLSDLASAGPGTLNVEVRSAGGQLVMRAGPRRLAGPGLPASAVRVLADHREAGTVRVSHGGNLLAIAMPVHYRAHHIPYAYGAEDFTLDVTSPAGRGAPGTLLVSLSLAGVGRATEPPGRHPAGHERHRGAGHGVPGRLDGPHRAPPSHPAGGPGGGHRRRRATGRMPAQPSGPGGPGAERRAEPARAGP